MHVFLPHYLGQHGPVITKHRLKGDEDKMRSFEMQSYFVE